MTSTRSWQFIGSPASAKTKAAASKALSFWPIGAAAGGGAAVVAALAGRGFLGGLALAGAFAEVRGVFFLVAMIRLPSFGFRAAGPATVAGPRRSQHSYLAGADTSSALAEDFPRFFRRAAGTRRRRTRRL